MYVQYYGGDNVVLNLGGGGLKYEVSTYPLLSFLAFETTANNVHLFSLVEGHTGSSQPRLRGADNSSCRQ